MQLSDHLHLENVVAGLPSHAGMTGGRPLCDSYFSLCRSKIQHILWSCLTKARKTKSTTGLLRYPLRPAPCSGLVMERMQ